MMLLLFFTFILFIFGLWMLMGINLFDVVSNILDVLLSREKSIYQKIDDVQTDNKKKNLSSSLKRMFSDTRLILIATNRSGLFITIVIVSIFLLIGGFLIGILLDNIFLSFVLSFGMSLIPFWFVKISENNYRNELNDELETALSIITTSYTRNNSIYKAIEENIRHISQPTIKDVFERFLIETRYISSSVEGALERMSKRIDNTIFEDWCLELIACQKNRNLKFTLKGIVRRFSNIRIVNGKLGVDIYESLKELVIASFMLVAFPILIYFMNGDWYYILAHTIVGKLTVAAQMAVVFIAINAGVNIARPISYER